MKTVEQNGGNPASVDSAVVESLASRITWPCNAVTGPSRDLNGLRADAWTVLRDAVPARSSGSRFRPGHHPLPESLVSPSISEYLTASAEITRGAVSEDAYEMTH